MALGQINGVLYSVKSLVRSIDQYNDINLQSVKNNAKSLEAALVSLNKSVLPNYKIYITSQPMLLGYIAQILNSNVIDIIKYNPELLNKSIIPANTRVKYL